jgi:hypothetical protein
MKSYLIAATAALTSSTMAIAQEKVQISYSGVLSVQHAYGTDLRVDYFHGNGDLSLRWSTVGDAKFGADFGIENFSTSNDDKDYVLTEYYASGVMEGRYGKVSLGMPRGVIEQYFYMPALGGSELLGREIAFMGSDLFRIFKTDASDNGGNLYSARYDGTIGQIDLATSFSRFSGSTGDLYGNIKEIAARFDGGLWSIVLGTSIVDFEEFSANSTSIEVQGRAGKLLSGMLYNKSNEQVIGPSSLRAFVAYDLSESVNLNSQILRYYTDGSSIDDIYSFDLSYKHRTGALFDAGLVTTKSWGDKIFNVSLGYMF